MAQRVVLPLPLLLGAGATPRAAVATGLCARRAKLL
jgi:hypothetical protein